MAVARWVVRKYPEFARKVVEAAYEPVKVVVPHAIRARYDRTHKTATWESGLIGGIVFADVNKYHVAPEARVSGVKLIEVPVLVLKARPSAQVRAWPVRLGKKVERTFTAWNIAGPAIKGGDGPAAPGAGPSAADAAGAAMRVKPSRMSPNIQSPAEPAS